MKTAFTEPNQIRKVLQIFESLNFKKFQWNKQLVMFEIEDLLTHLHSTLQQEPHPELLVRTEVKDAEFEQQQAKFEVAVNGLPDVQKPLEKPKLVSKEKVKEAASDEKSSESETLLPVFEFSNKVSL